MVVETTCKDQEEEVHNGEMTEGQDKDLEDFHQLEPEAVEALEYH